MTTFTFSNSINKANKETILEQCIELYNSNEFDFTVSRGTITGIKAMSQSVELFCMCNELN